MVIGNTYALYEGLSFMTQFIQVFSWEGFTYIPFVAIFKFITGQLSIMHFIVLVFIALSAMCWVGGVFFVGFQFLLVIYGFTSFDAWKGGKMYGSKSTMENIRSVFGEWYKIPLQFLFPFRVNQGNNGTDWVVTNKSVKTQ